MWESNRVRGRGTERETDRQKKSVIEENKSQGVNEMEK